MNYSGHFDYDGSGYNPNAQGQPPLQPGQSRYGHAHSQSHSTAQNNPNAPNGFIAQSRYPPAQQMAGYGGQYEVPQAAMYQWPSPPTSGPAQRYHQSSHQPSHDLHPQQDIMMGQYTAHSANQQPQQQQQQQQYTSLQQVLMEQQSSQQLRMEQMRQTQQTLRYQQQQQQQPQSSTYIPDPSAYGMHSSSLPQQQLQQPQPPSQPMSLPYPAGPSPGNPHAHFAVEIIAPSMLEKPQHLQTRSKDMNNHHYLATQETVANHAPPQRASKTAQAEKPANPPQQPDEVRIPYDMVLISLSEEYMDAAHKLGPRVGLLGEMADVETYNGLVAAGLGCLEACLKNFKFPPRLEAALTMRYASLLYDETESYPEMEATLSKGIALCDRNKLVDLQYSMHHLLARVAFKTNPKAALKALDTTIQEVEAYKHIPWVYALRFLRVSLSIEMCEYHETIVALQHLKSISDLSESQRDSAIFVTCAALESFVHLRSESPDNIMNAQQAIAQARSLQLQESADQVHQVWALLNCVDLACALLQYNAEQAAQKLKILQEQMEDLVIDNKLWSDDGCIEVPLGPSSAQKISDFSSQIYEKKVDGKVVLGFSWLHKRDVYAMTHLLSSCCSLLKNPTERKAERYTQAGLDMIEENLNRKNLAQHDVIPSSSSRAEITRRLNWMSSIHWHLQLYQAFLYCIHANWGLARQSLKALEETLEKLTHPNAEQLARWTRYLHGIIEQSSGNSEAAAQIFRSPLVSAVKPSATRRLGSAYDDIAILSRLNLLLLLRSPGQAPTAEAQFILDELTSLIPSSHPNSAMQAALALLSAIINPRDSIIKKKGALQTALHMSRAISNAQLLAVTMVCMVNTFFTNIVGKQARDGKHTARALAIRAGDPLWISVAGGIAEGEDERVQAEVEISVSRLPEQVRDRFTIQ